MPTVKIKDMSLERIVRTKGKTNQVIFKGFIEPAAYAALADMSADADQIVDVTVTELQERLPKSAVINGKNTTPKAGDKVPAAEIVGGDKPIDQAY